MKKIVYLLPVLSGILWGSVGIFVRILTELGMDSFTVTSSRLVMAAVVMGITIFIYDKRLFYIRLKDLWIFGVGGLLGMLGVVLAYNEAIKQVTLSLAAVLLSMSPIFVLFFAAILFHEKITLKKTGCMVLALCGCVMVSGILEYSSGMKWTPMGIGFGILAAFCYALYSLVGKAAMKKGYHAFTMTFYCMAIIAVCMLPVTDWECIRRITVDGGIKMILFMLIHALFASVFPYVFYTLSLNYIEAGKVSILAAGEPVAAMIFGFVFFAEKPTVLSILGLVLTTSSLVLLSLPEKKSMSKENTSKEEQE
ncbi:MAG: DMT family transporter [Lachnospiraceae bacterium]